MFGLWATWFAFALGFLILLFRDFYLFPVFIVAGYLAILLVFLTSVRIWRDWFNPLCLILGLGFIRFSLPGLLLMFGANPQFEFFPGIGVQSLDWRMGHALALTGLLSVAIGWSLVQGRSGRPLRLRSGSGGGVSYAASGTMLAGFVAILLFIGSNAPLLETVSSGTLRGTTIQEGTGVFFYLSHFLITGSVILSGYLLTQRGGLKWTSLIPVVLAMTSFFILGGRGRAMVPLISGLLLWWYLRQERSGWGRASFRPIYALALLGVPFLTWVGYFGQLYRGGMGIQAFQESLSLQGLWEYLQWAIFVDIGHLHALAGAAAIQPGALGGTTFTSSLLWPLSQILGLAGKNPGVFIVERLVGITQRKWGVASSLIGDAYLNYGIAGIPIVMGLFGLLAKTLYVRFRSGSIRSPVYVLLIVYGIQIFFGSINVWQYTVVVMSFAVITILVGGLLERQPAFAPPLRRRLILRNTL